MGAPRNHEIANILKLYLILENWVKSTFDIFWLIGYEFVIMSRPLRIEYPDAWYHVMNRGRRMEAIFSNEEDYKRFTELLKETSEMWNGI